MYTEHKMLIVDDLDIDRDILREIFENDFDILEAVNGKEGIDFIKKYGKDISIVLLDIHMPIASGIDVLKFRQTNPVFSSIPVVVITINDDTKSQMETFQLGATDFITKPFVEEMIRYRIHNVLSTCQIEEVVRERENLRVKAELDLMTGIYNKVTIEHMISKLLATNTTICAMLIIDIDDFKQINDVHGHLMGDQVIRTVADLISRYFRKTDIVGRIGGDEFIVFMSGLPSMDLARQKASDFSELFKYTPDITAPANVSISIGMAISEPCPCSYETLFKQADEALYNAKRNGKAQYAEYGMKKQLIPVQSGIRASLLLSTCRDVRSAISKVNENTRLLTIFSTHEAQYFKKEFTGKVSLLYIDISTRSDDGEELLTEMLDIDWLQHIPFVAICQEGNMGQYATAIRCGAVDIFPAPIDTVFAKRRLAELS